MITNIEKNYKNLCLKSGTINQRWYVEYYYTDNIGKWKQVKKYGGINNYKTLKDRKDAASLLLTGIHKELEQGAHILQTTGLVNRKGCTLSDAIKSFMDNRLEYVRPKTLELYRSILERHLTTYAEVKHLNQKAITKIESQDIKGFLDYRNSHTKTGMPLSKGSFNSYVTTLRAFFNFCISQKMLFDNPMNNKVLLSKKKNNVGRIAMFEESHAKSITEWLGLYDKTTLLFIRLIYYCAIRPEEIRRLQVYNFKFNQKTPEGGTYHEIYIEAAKSKNNNNDSVLIPQRLAEDMQTLGLNDVPSTYYLFSSNRLLGKAPVSKNYFYYPFNKCLTALKLHGRGYTPYLFKHKSNVDAYLNGADLYSIMVRNRHSSLKQTEHYLKSLGIKLKQVELPLIEF